MKKKLLNNLPWKICAVIIAIGIWAFVMNLEDPINTKTFDDISVVISNAEAIVKENQTYGIVGEATVSVKVKARRSVLNNIEESDISAIADCKNISLGKLVPIVVEIGKYEGKYESANPSSTNLEINIEEKESLKLPITIIQKGTPKEGFFVSETTTSPENVTIEGAKSKIKKINKAVVEINVDDLSTDKKSSKKLDLYDKNGDEVELNGLNLDIQEDTIAVYVKVKPNKKVKVHPIISGSVNSEYEVTSVKVEPSEIEIAGDEETLEKIQEIPIEGLFDISSASGSLERTVDIKPHLPKGIYLASEEGEKILVTIEIKRKATDVKGEE